MGAATPPPPSRSADFACPSGEVPDDGFVDTAGNTFEPVIECLAWYEITSGGPAGLPANAYGPNLSVSRAQMATFLVRFLDHVDPGRIAGYDGTNDFVDVTAENVHVASINRLADAGIVSGGAGGQATNTFSPDNDVSRDQMATFVARAVGNILEADLCPGNISDYFDDDADNTHETCINGMADIAIVGGDVSGNYNPGNDVVRGQMAGFLMRAMDLLVEQEVAGTPD